MYTDWSTQTLIEQIEKIDIGIGFSPSPQEVERLQDLKALLEAEIDARRIHAGKPPLTGVQRRADAFRTEVDVYVGIRIRQGRVHTNVSQKELGQAIGLTQGGVSDVETGKRSLTVAELLRAAIALALPVSFFLEPVYPDVVKTGWERVRPDTVR